MGVAPPEILKSIAKEASELVPHEMKEAARDLAPGADPRAGAAAMAGGSHSAHGGPRPGQMAGAPGPQSGRFSRNSVVSTRSAATTGCVSSRSQRGAAEQRAPWGYRGRTTRRGSIAWTTQSGRRRSRQMSITSMTSTHLSSETASTGFSSEHPNETPFLRYFRKRDSFGEAPPPHLEALESQAEEKETERAQPRTLSEIHNDEDYWLTTFIERRREKWKDSPAYPKRQRGPLYLSQESVRLAEEVKELAWVGSLPPSPR